MDTVGWLLEGDPAIRWQAYRDLLGEPGKADATRSLIAQEGWGAELLGHQDPEGTWAHALYSPKWTSTTYSLLLLHRFGLPATHPSAQLGTQVLIDRARYIDGGATLAKTIPEPETCITGMLVLLASSFRVDDHRVDGLVEWLVDTQMDDGGWNCEVVRSGATHGSFHTSITVLEALAGRNELRPDARVAEAIARGHRFFLDHRLYHSHRTGEIVDDVFTRFSFPPYWHFDALRALDHFQSVGASRSPELTPAIELLEQRRASDSRWPLQNVHRNRTWFTMERGGRPSRWNTLRALRVLRWWNGTPATGTRHIGSGTQN
jgi:hypothetical protein